MPPNMPKKVEAKRDRVINPNIYNFNQITITIKGRIFCKYLY